MRQTIKAELALLGSILINNNALPKAFGLIAPAFFTNTKRSLMFRAMCDLAFDDEEIDLLTLTCRLERMPEWADCGGSRADVASLIDWIPDIKSVDRYTEIIRDAVIIDTQEITTLISRVTQLTDDGHIKSGPCPFHDDKGRSLHVDGDRQLFYCSGCGLGGDAAKFTGLMIAMRTLTGA